MTANSFVKIPLQDVDPDNPDSTEITLRYDIFVAKLFKFQTPDLMKLHAALGVCTEAGELGDPIKAHVIYGKPLDLPNIVEELGDLRFFMQALMNQLGISEQEVLQHNANKLATRYSSLEYTDAKAINRADKT